jgi:NAD(P)-dependent dehydrogenase (short-subunit alcohol dehydrogenase family)
LKNFAGKICFITGGASGAGLGQAKIFAKAGMKVAIADIRADALHAAVTEIINYAGCTAADVLPLCFDITDRKAFASAADTVEKVFGGAPHLFIQTAGVNSFGPVEASTYDDYDWVVGVCFDAVVNGFVTFVPRILKQYGGTFGAPKEEFHIVTVSSLGGHEAGPGTGPYSAAKAAVINLTYSFAEVLPAYGGHATVLCPWNINTNIGNAELYRPEELRETGYNVNEKTVAMLRTVHAQGQDPLDLAQVLKQRIEEDRVLVFPFHTIEEGMDMLRNEHHKEELYMLPEKERLAQAESQLSDPTHLYEYYDMKDGVEAFGLARPDRDFVTDTRKPNKK